MSTLKYDSHYFARLISNVASPPVWMLATAVLAILATPGTSIWIYLLAYAIPVILLPSLYIVYLFNIGQVTDLHMKRREERIRPMMVSIACSLIALVGLFYSLAPRFLVLVAAAITCQLIGFILITTFWKVSLHTTAAVTCIIMAYWFNSTLAYLLLPLLGLVVWARIRLQYHTVGQVAGGILLGTGTLGMALLLFASEI